MRALLKFLDIVSLYQLFYNDFLSVDKRGVCRGELHDVQWVQRVACMSAYRSADARNRFYQCHNS